MHISATEAIRLALTRVLEENNKSVCLGLGINDPKRIFGTTSGLVEKFGSERIIEPPTSENALTGISLGLAINGYSVCLMHQRLDFALLSFDQLINSLAKWKFMYGDKDCKLPVLIRLIVGRGWGQGPTHSQSYHSFLASIPGLNVLYPFKPQDFYASVLKGMRSGTPTILIEHRWLHNTTGCIDVSQEEIDSDPIIIVSGKDLTVFTYGYLVPDFIKAAEYLEQFAISIEIISTVSLVEIDVTLIESSARKTRKLLIAEPYTFSSSISSTVASQVFSSLVNESCDVNVSTLSLPFEPESTSFFLTKQRYLSVSRIIQEVGVLLGKDIPLPSNSEPHDIPGDWFKGPF